MIVSDTAIRNRITVLVVVVIIIVAGIYSYVTLPREAAPDVAVPYILITSVYEGASPQDVEEQVTSQIEKKLTGIKGVKEIRSSSAEELSVITVEFMPDVQIEDALQRVKDKVDQSQSDLPKNEDFEDPIVSEINVAEFPIMVVNMTGQSLVQLKEVADELEDAIEAIPGVLDCEVLGTLEREIRLEIDPDRVAAYGLTVQELLKLIPAENVNVTAGGIETPGTKFNVRIGAEFQKPEEVDHLLLTVRGGKPIYLADVARVVDTFKDRQTYSRLNGEPTITLQIKKRVGANIMDITAQVRGVLAEARKLVPADVKFLVTMDQSTDIDAMINDLENNLFAAFVLVIAVLLISMGWRSSLVVAVAIPLSMLMSLTILNMLGYTLNMIVLFALVLSVGMLVDNAIVIVENIYRFRQLGFGRIESAMKGAAEVAWPVITSTLTTVAAFLPLIFWPGIMGDFMKYLPITVIIVLSCSLFVAMVVSPVIVTLFKESPKQRNAERPFFRFYRRLLSLTLHHRFTTLVVAFMVLIGLFMLYKKRGEGVEFFPDPDPKQAQVTIRAPQGTNVLETDRIVREVEKRVNALNREKHDIKYVIASAGTSGGGRQALLSGGGKPSSHSGSVRLIFKDFADRARPSIEAIADLRELVKDIEGAEVTVDREKAGPPTGAPVAIQIIGPDFARLGEISKGVTAKIADVPGLVNLQSDLEATRPEIEFLPDRQRQMLLGVNTFTVGNFLKTAIFGSKVGTYRQFNDEYDITVRLPEEQRDNFDDILRLQVPNESGKAVPLSSVGRFDFRGGYGTIYRVNQERVVTLSGDVQGRLANDVLADVRERLAGTAMPLGYQIRYAGQQEEQQDAQAFLGKAFIIALLLVVLVLVAQFNTLTVPVIIMTTVPLSLIGVLIGLLSWHLPFGVIMTGIGMISLSGVVVNNAIVLLDYTRVLQREGRDLIDAAVEAGVTRLRPVLLTATTTVIGLLPTALGMGFNVRTFEWITRSESSQWWQNMAVALVFGLTFATVLTLVFVPTLYVSLYQLANRLGYGGLKKPDAQAEPAGAE